MIRRCGDNPKQENVISHRSACLLVGGKLAARNSIKVKVGCVQIMSVAFIHCNNVEIVFIPTT